MHRRKLRVEKGEEQKTALLLIHDQEKVNMAKKQTKQGVYSLGKRSATMGKVKTQTELTSWRCLVPLTHSPESVLRLSTFITQKQCLKEKKSEHFLQQRFHLLQEQNCFR